MYKIVKKKVYYLIEGTARMDKKLNEYAKLVIEVGVNVQKEQVVVIRTPIEGVAFARLLTKHAYEVGAKRVYVEFSDEEIGKMTYQYATEETLGQFPEWETQKYKDYVNQNAAFISISASNPDLLKDIPVSKIATAQRASGKGLSYFRRAISHSDVCWCVVSIPTASWSQKVFPECTDSEVAKNKLWDKIFEVTRINEVDPVAAWKEHIKRLAKRCQFLNEKRIKTLHYTAPGTDLYVELPKGHKWEGGGEYSTKGTYFVANMPTEEVFTMPYKYGVNGTLRATKPLVYGGNLIDNFSFEFKEGKIVHFEAEKGKDILEKLIETDKGTVYLGEVAIVPNSSPVSKANTLFYNTLFDENASCHFAIGSCYPTNIEGGVTMSDEELEKHGGNTSIEHEDFMVGSDKLSIVATTVTGETFEVLKNGEWAF